MPNVVPKEDLDLRSGIEAFCPRCGVCLRLALPASVIQAMLCSICLVCEGKHVHLQTFGGEA